MLPMPYSFTVMSCDEDVSAGAGGGAGGGGWLVGLGAWGGGCVVLPISLVGVIEDDVSIAKVSTAFSVFTAQAPRTHVRTSAKVVELIMAVSSKYRQSPVPSVCLKKYRRSPVPAPCLKKSR